MNLLNVGGDLLARSLQRRLARAGLPDVSAISVDPPDGSRLTLAIGSKLHRIEVVRLPDLEGVTSEPLWTPLVVGEDLGREAQDLAERGISFLDNQGRAHLFLNGRTVLDQNTHTTPAKPAARPEARQEPPGLRLSRVNHQIVFALLCEPDLASASIRQLAEVAQVSIGTAQATRHQLKRLGFIWDDSLHRTGELLDTWVGTWRGLSIPSLTDRAMYASDSDWAYRLLSGSGEMLASGAAAAARLELGLRASDGIIYTPHEPGSAIRALQLRTTETPWPVTLRRMFWPEPRFPIPKMGIVPSPLLYADLQRETDSRVRDAAASLRRKDAHLRALDD